MRSSKNDSDGAKTIALAGLRSCCGSGGESCSLPLPLWRDHLYPTAHGLLPVRNLLWSVFALAQFFLRSQLTAPALKDPKTTLISSRQVPGVIILAKSLLPDSQIPKWIHLEATVLFTVHPLKCRHRKRIKVQELCY